jgi:putative glutamate/gamma-aminobutyrate antiporter
MSVLTKDRKTPSKAAPSKTSTISAGQLTILTVVAVASLRSLPTIATFGLGSIVYYVLPALVFLIPTALVAAELATGWKGGVYVWVREAMGNRWGFLAIWLQWIQNVVWYPVQLAFIAAAVAFTVGDNGLANSGLFTAIVILVLYYGSTFIGLRGGTLFAKVGSWGGVVGTLVPGLVLIIAGAVWLGIGQKAQVPLHLHDVIPPFAGLSSIVLIVSNFLAYAGMEVNAVHVNRMRDPGKDYPKVIFYASMLILGIFILPTLAVAFIVPKADLGFTSGIVYSFKIFFDHFGVGWAGQILAAMVAVGAFAAVVTWIAGPSKGLLLAGETGVLPKTLQRRNKAGVQEGILILQAFIVTVLAAIFVLVHNVSAAFFTLVDMAAALYLIMYMMMFASAILLRKNKPDVKRTYRVPALTVVASIGFLASLAAFCLGFVPPSGLAGISTSTYPYVMGAVIVILGTPPLIFYAVKKPSWKVHKGRTANSDMAEAN